MQVVELHWAHPNEPDQTIYIYIYGRGCIYTVEDVVMSITFGKRPSLSHCDFERKLEKHLY